ncbi:MAG: tetratricopeptide repeat protein [Opitutaceae bacterium]|nr:tetratricopeptide repeat protein [Opitutaceae bacterium]
MLRTLTLFFALFFLGTATSPAKEDLPRSETLGERQLKVLVQEEKEIWEILKSRTNQEDIETLRPRLRDIAASYDNIISENPDFVAAYVSYGLLLSRIGERKASVTFFLQANEIDPNIPLVKNQLGNYCIEEGEYEEALSYYLSAIKLAPEEPLYRYQLGTLLTEFRRFFIADELFSKETLEKKMHEAFQKAATLAPSDFGYACRYAESFYDLREPNWEEALLLWETLEEMAPTNVEKQTAQLHRANIYLKQERFLGARLLLNKITEASLESNKQTLLDQLNQEAEN